MGEPIHISVACVEEVVDLAMNCLPLHLDLSDEKDRAKMKAWMVRICSVVAMKVGDSLEAVLANVVREAVALSIDPKYHEKKKARRLKRKLEKSRAKKSQAEVAFDLLSRSTVKM